MDNQNKSKGGIIDIPKNIIDGTFDSGEKVKKMTDSSGLDLESDTVVRPGGVENIQTQSMVQTNRESANSDLERIKAYNEAVLRQEMNQVKKQKTEKAAVHVFIGIIIVCLAAAIVWLILNVIIASRPPADPDDGGNGGDETKQYESVEGYDCKTELCYKAADLPDGRVLLRDDSYYTYDTKTKDMNLLALDSETYHDVSAFVWGEKTLLDVDPESQQSGLFSLTDNRMITSFSYDSFYKDADSKEYGGMEWAIGSYIIAKANGSYRLIKLSSGEEIVRGSSGVFIHDGYCFGYESDGERRAYTMNGARIKNAAKGTHFYIKNNYLVYANNNEDPDIEVYDANGEPISEGAVYDELEDIDENVIDVINGNSSYYKVPASR